MAPCSVLAQERQAALQAARPGQHPGQLSQTVQAILVLVLGRSEKSSLRQQIAADIRREQLGQLRASDVSQSDSEEWTAEGASMKKPPTQGHRHRHRPLQRKDFPAAEQAAAAQDDDDDDSDSSHLLGSSIDDGLSTRCEEEEEEEESKATQQQQRKERPPYDY